MFEPGICLTPGQDIHVLGPGLRNQKIQMEPLKGNTPCHGAILCGITRRLEPPVACAAQIPIFFFSWRREVTGRPPPKPEAYAANLNPHIPAILKRARRFFEINEEMIS